MAGAGAGLDEVLAVADWRTVLTKAPGEEGVERAARPARRARPRELQ